ncbi:30S ribosome-binding factor RbfA [Aminiphilus sp.]|jgi:ribosome-binding factor A|uniref:30S ribosome-binding factor RbfA n=1 Tax=Aminiphilus sp. TaxID=1872488 RepID=UPI0026350A8E|nr:30S ribosome-binding factor RbfA [Aminiphilus sp.]
MATFRIERINKEMLREISEILQRRIKDESVKKAILTGVECSRDLSYAKIYFMLLDSSEKEEVSQALTNVAGKIRGMLGKMMRLRHIPELHFFYDHSEERARQIDALLDRIAGKNGGGESRA